MGRPKRNEVLGDTYHVFFRGNRGEKIFRQVADYTLFLKDLEALAEAHHVAVIAYCLMPNHVHLCVRTRKGGSLLATLMQRLNLRHARRYNRAYRVRGRLNESRYHAKVVVESQSPRTDQRKYLTALVRYIHANPVRARLTLSAGEWRYSSHASYVGNDMPWVESAEVLKEMGGVEGYSAVMATAQPPEEEQMFRPPRREPPTSNDRLEEARALIASAERSALYAGKRLAPELRAARLLAAKELLLKGFSHREIAQALETRPPPLRASEDEPPYGLAA